MGWMKSFWTMVALCVCWLGPVGPVCAQDGPIYQSQQSIRNGTRLPEAVPLTAGEQLAIGWLHTAGDPTNAFCTATLISPLVVATAEHCTRDRNAVDMAFGIGSLPSEPLATFQVVNKAERDDVDAALLILAEDAVARVPELRPILPNRTNLDDPDESERLIGREVQVAGYGDTRSPDLVGRFFATVELKEIQDDFVVVDGRGIQGLCFGDSGGPVITLNQRRAPVMLGVEHGGDDSCLGTDYLTRLDPLSDWINNAIEFTTPDTPIGSPCGEIDYLGRCIADSVEWCESGRLARLNCAERGQVCDFVDTETGFFCTADGGGFGSNAVGVIFEGRPACDTLGPGAAPWWLALILFCWFRRRR